MKSLNKVFILGRLGTTPELMTAKNGRPYTRLNVATNRSWKDDDDTWKELTDWHSVTVWANQAKACVSSLEKGALVFVEGFMSTYKVPAEEGDAKESRTTLTANKVTFFTHAKRALAGSESELAVG